MNKGLIAALAVTLAGVWYVSGEGGDAGDGEDPSAVRGEGSRAARNARLAGSAPAAVPDAVIARLPERAAAEVARDLFAVQSMLPPPPPGSDKPPPPPPPVAPPLPFRYQGRMIEGQDTVVFLTQGDRVLVARKGDLIANQYRVEAITPSAITFMFEPLKQQQTLSTGSAK